MFKKNNQSMFIYETDNLEHARDVIENNPGAGVIYHDTSSIPTPFLHLKMGERIYTKHNPDYIAYLKREFPEMSDKEIIEHMQNLAQAEINSDKKTR